MKLPRRPCVVSFRLTKKQYQLAEEVTRKTGTLGAYTVPLFARKLLMDFCRGLNTYPDPANLHHDVEFQNIINEKQIKTPVEFVRDLEKKFNKDNPDLKAR
jgi:hypothetical protein